MKFWLDVDGALLRTAAALADPIQKALTASVDVEDVLSQWERTYPAGTDITRLEGRQWARNTISVDDKPMLDVLGKVYATGYVFGDLVATAAYGHETLKTKASDPKPPSPEQVEIAINVDWANWVPGNKPAAELLRPKGALSKLLATRKTLVDGLKNTTVEHFGNILANGLAAGTDRFTLAEQLKQYLKNPSRALTISTTELTRGMQTTALEQFKEFGATVRWLALDPCDVCSGNASAGVVSPGYGFTDVNGDTIYNPPAHPHCRCSLTPVVDLNPDIPSLDLALQAALVKYSEDQARDYRGRFASNGFTAGAWETADKKELVANAVSRYNSTHQYADGSPLTPEDIEKFRKKSQRYYGSVDVYENGPIKVVVPKNFDAKETFTSTAEILKHVDELQTARPLDHVEIKVNNTYFGSTLGEHTGYVDKNTGEISSVITINTFAIQGSVAFQQAGMGKTRNPMPLETGNLLEFTMAHEWGHGFDNKYQRSKAFHDKLSQQPKLWLSMSSYGKKSVKESFAEAFAQNYMEDKLGVEKMPLTAAFEGDLR